MNEKTLEVVTRMGQFAANTRDDRLSNAVARVAKSRPTKPTVPITANNDKNEKS